MIEKNFRIKGMSCMHCVIAVKRELSKLNLESAEVEIGNAKIKFEETKVAASAIENSIKEAGYEVEK